MCALWYIAHHEPIHWNLEASFSLQIVERLFFRREGHDGMSRLLDFFVEVTRVEGNTEVNIAVGFKFRF